MLLLDRIEIEDEEEDVEFCAYTIMGAAFNTIMVNSPAIATLINPELKMKDDAIAQLSDQLMALTARMQEIERKQQQI